jgi:hypothetical protein
VPASETTKSPASGSPQLSEKRISRSSSFVISSPRVHPYKPDLNILKSASSEFLLQNHSQTYSGLLPFGSDSILDLFPGLAAATGATLSSSSKQRDHHEAKKGTTAMSPMLSGKRASFAAPMCMSSALSKDKLNMVGLDFSVAGGDALSLNGSGFLSSFLPPMITNHHYLQQGTETTPPLTVISYNKI